MVEAISDERWAAGRALVEGEPTTHARVGAAMGVHATTVSHKAREEGWNSLDYRFIRVRRAQRALVQLSRRLKAGEEPDETAEAEVAAEPEPAIDLPEGTMQERLARIGERLARRAEAMLLQAEAGRPLESRQVAALSSMMQLCDRLAETAREDWMQQSQQSDEDLAGALRAIDERILELAYHETRHRLIHTFGIDEAEVDRRMPPPPAPMAPWTAAAQGSASPSLAKPALPNAVQPPST